ncbi:hypothetical protein D3C81_2188010 [compost metagenome]
MAETSSRPRYWIVNCTVRLGVVEKAGCGLVDNADFWNSLIVTVRVSFGSIPTRFGVPDASDVTSE